MRAGYGISALAAMTRGKFRRATPSVQAPRRDKCRMRGITSRVLQGMSMRRKIAGFHADEYGGWVARLERGLPMRNAHGRVTTLAPPIPSRCPACTAARSAVRRVRFAHVVAYVESGIGARGAPYSGTCGIGRRGSIDPGSRRSRGATRRSVRNANAGDAMRCVFGLLDSLSFHVRSGIRDVASGRGLVVRSIRTPLPFAEHRLQVEARRRGPLR